MPKDAIHLLTGILYQCAMGLGRTSARQMIDILELLYEQKFASLSQDKLLIEALKIVDFLNLCYTGNIRRQIEREMKLAEEKGDSAKMAELMVKFKGLL